MKLDNVLEKTEEFFKKWELDFNDWILIAHYAHKLEGYRVKVRKGHFNIMVNKEKLSWIENSWIKGWKYQAFPPVNSKWAKEYNLWQKKTKFDIDFIPLSKKELNKFIRNKKYSFFYKLPNKKKIRVIKVRGLLRRYEDSLPSPDSIEKELGLEKANYLLKIIEEWKKLAQERKEKEVVRVCDKLLKKYNFLKAKLKAVTNYEKIKTIKGMPVFKGKTTGKVKLFLDRLRPGQVGKEEILVAKMTSAKFTPVACQAKAIITDEGGLLCHAAILSREFKIPCIINTKVATKILRDGDLIAVDAEKGIVRILDKVK